MQNTITDNNLKTKLKKILIVFEKMEKNGFSDKHFSLNFDIQQTIK